MVLTLRAWWHVKPRCPKFVCRCPRSNTKNGPFVRNGAYFRKSDSKWIYRWKCLQCRVGFSQATGHPCFGQKKRRVNEPLRRLLCSGISMRRCARVLRISRTTVARKLEFLAGRARFFQRQFLLRQSGIITHVQFDEMETFVHTKYKPLSIALAVDERRKILAYEVSQMPAKSALAERAKRRYGHRKDERSKGLVRLFERLKPYVSEHATFRSDKNPLYPAKLKKAFPNARHETTDSRRAAVVGQGELKVGKWDPLFALNHTAAMFRYGMSRLIRRTWCTTKTRAGLINHLALYTDFHNQILTQ